MSKRLAIRGHSTRGNEVIEILEMMGGKNTEGYIGIDRDEFYTIEDGCIIQSYDWNDCLILSLEEFLDKYPFNVGDKVADVYGKSLTIKSMGWLEDLETMVYAFEETSVVLSAKDLKPINDVGIKIENINMNIEFDLTKYSYEVKDGKLVISEKKPKYPTTYAECKEMMSENTHYGFSAFTTLQNLIICRDAYWKMAGEEMGLGKSLEPEYVAFEDKTYFIIQTFNGEIDKSATSHRNAILAFPTIEMRNIFYENFKDLIEECKALL